MHECKESKSGSYYPVFFREVSVCEDLNQCSLGSLWGN